MFREEEGKESGASIPQENLHVVRNIFMVNQVHQENLVRKTFMVNQSHLMKSVQLVQRVIQVWN